MEVAYFFFLRSMDLADFDSIYAIAPTCKLSLARTPTGIISHLWKLKLWHLPGKNFSDHSNQ